MTNTMRRLASSALLVCLALAVTGRVQAQDIVYYHTDALGTPVAMTDGAGNVIERREFEPYGRQLSPTTLVDGPNFTGHVSDAATGLDYMQQRYFDSEIGAFLSVDPLNVDLNSGEGFNRYAYGFDNPFAFSDPDGRDPERSGQEENECRGRNCRPQLPEGIPDPPKGCGISRNCFYYSGKWHITEAGDSDASVGYINDGPLEGVHPELYLIGGWEVAGYRSVAALRTAYLEGVDQLVAQGAKMTANGSSAQEAARMLVPLRNALKDQIRRAGPITARMAAEFRNFIKYGNRLGPSAEQQFSRYGSWERVLERLGKTDSTVNKVAGK